MKLWIGLFLLPVACFATRVPNIYEKVPAGEAEHIQELNAMILSTLKVHRDAHAKGHGCVDDVTVRVDENIPKNLQRGFFANPGSEHKALIRFSNGSGQPNVDDRQGGGQGLALKILLNEDEKSRLIPVTGEARFADSKYYDTFDILMISSVREFFVETVADYKPFFIAKGTAEGAAGKALAEGKSPLEAAAIAQKVLGGMYLFPPGREPRTREAGILARLSSDHPVFLLNTSYNSFVPSLLGKRAVKYEARPCTEQKTEDLMSKIPASLAEEIKTQPNFLRSTLKWELESQDGCFDLYVQVHSYGHPTIEDAAAKWNTKVSDYVKVARIEIPRKSPDAVFFDEDLCETISFHPGHASAEHYPIGGIQRARVGDEKQEGIYTVIANQRNLNRGKTPVGK